METSANNINYEYDKYDIVDFMNIYYVDYLN